MKLRIVAVMAGVMVVLGVLGGMAWQGVSLLNGGVAFAQGPTVTPTTGTSTTGAPQPPADVLAAAESFWKNLASQLGIQENDLKSKAVAAEKAVIDQAVADGNLTADQATQLKAQLDQNGPSAPEILGRHGGRGGPGGKGGPGGPGGHGQGAGLDEIEAVAKVLNLKPADMLTQIQSGKTVADLAKSQNVSETTVKQAYIDAVKAHLAREVQDGLLTQAQADQQTTNLTLDKVDLTQLFDRPARPTGQPQAQPTTQP